MTTPDPTTPPVNPAPPPPAPPAPVTTFTQDDVNVMIAREKDQARRQATREIAERLGCSVEEAEQHLKDTREAEAAKLTEAERRERAAAEREAAAQAAEAAAHRLALTNRVTSALFTEKIRPERAALAAGQVTVEPDADDTAIATAVAKYKAEVPEFFIQEGTPAPTPTTPPAPAPTGTPSSTPAPAPPAPQQVSDAFAKGAERAKAAQPQSGGIPGSLAQTG